MEGSGSSLAKIVVGVRVRPLLPHEREDGASEAVSAACVSTHTHTDAYILDKPLAREFPYDFAYTPSHTNEDVYAAQGKRIVEGVVEGYNGTLFAYGQTSSGKTHTITGGGVDGSHPGSQPGVLHMCVRDLFAQLAARTENEYVVRVSVLEIYNEQLRDLLEPSNAKLTIYEDSIRGATVKDVTEMVAVSEGDVLESLRRGMSNRTIGSTAMNEMSSRSHTIFRITVESRPNDAVLAAAAESDSAAPAAAPSTTGGNILRAWPTGRGAAKIAILNLVDLAGSERASKTKSSGVRLKEGASINKSLLTLGLVISGLAKLSESSAAPAGRASLGGGGAVASPISPAASDGVGGAASPASGGVHIPYRDSKLTRLLQNSLGGNARTAIIANVSPASTQIEETRSTLQFASRARKVINRPTVNETPEGATLVAQYQAEIVQLRQRADQLALERAALESRLDAELHRATALERRADAAAGSASVDALQRAVLASSDVLLRVRNRRKSAAFVARIAQRLSDVGRGVDDLGALAADAEAVVDRLRARAQAKTQEESASTAAPSAAGDACAADETARAISSDEEDEILSELRPARLRGDDDAPAEAAASPPAGPAGTAGPVAWPEGLLRDLCALRDALPAGSAPAPEGSEVLDDLVLRLRDGSAGSPQLALSPLAATALGSILRQTASLQRSTHAQELHIQAIMRENKAERRALRNDLASAQKRLSVAATELSKLVGDGDVAFALQPSAEAPAQSPRSATSPSSGPPSSPTKHRRGLTGMQDVSVDRIKDSFETIRKRAQQHEEEAARLREQLESLNKRMTLSESEMKTAMNERSFLHAQVTELSKTLATLQEQRDDALERIESLNEELTEAQARAAQQAASMEEAWSTRVALLQGDLERVRQQAATAAAALEAERDRASKESVLQSQHVAEISSLRTRLTAVTAERDSAVAQVTQLSAEIRQTTEAARADATMAADRCAAAAVEISALTGERDAALLRAQAAEAAAAAAASEAAALRGTAAEAQQSTEVLQQAVKTLQQANDGLQVKVTAADEQAQDFKAAAEAADAQRAVLCAEHAALAKDLASAQQQLSVLSSSLESQIELARTAAAQSTADALIQRIAALQREIDELRASKQEERAELEGRLAAAVEEADDTRAKLHTTEQALARAVEDREHFTKQAAEAVSAGRTAEDFARLESELAARRADAAERESTVAAATRRCDELREELTQKDRELMDLQLRLGEIEQRMASSAVLARTAEPTAAGELAAGTQGSASLTTSPTRDVLDALGPLATPKSSAQLMQSIVLEQTVVHAQEQANATIAALLTRVRELEQQLDNDRKSGMQIAVDALLARMRELESQSRAEDAHGPSASLVLEMAQQRDAALDLARRGSVHIHGLIACINGLRGAATRAGAPVDDVNRLLSAASNIVHDARQAEKAAGQLQEVAAGTRTGEVLPSTAVARMDADVATLAKELRELDRSAFAADNERLTKELVSTRAELEAVQQSCVQLATRLNEVSGELETTAAERDAAMQRAAAADSRASEFDVEVQRQREAVSTLQLQLKDMSLQRADVSQHSSIQDSQDGDAQTHDAAPAAADMLKVREELEMQAANLHRLQVELDGWRAHFGDASAASVAQSVADGAAAVADLRRQLAQAQDGARRCADAEGELARVNTEHATLSNECSKLTAELQRSGTRIEELVATCASLLSSKTTLRDHLAERDRQVRLLSAQLEVMTRTVAELEARVVEDTAAAAQVSIPRLDTASDNVHVMGGHARDGSSLGFSRAVSPSEQGDSVMLRAQLEALKQSSQDDKRLLAQLQSTVQSLQVAAATRQVPPPLFSATAPPAATRHHEGPRSARSTASVTHGRAPTSRRSRRSSCSACSHHSHGSMRSHHSIGSRAQDGDDDDDDDDVDGESVHTVVPDERNDARPTTRRTARLSSGITTAPALAESTSPSGQAGATTTGSAALSSRLRMLVGANIDSPSSVASDKPADGAESPRTAGSSVAGGSSPVSPSKIPLRAGSAAAKRMASGARMSLSPLAAVAIASGAAATPLLREASSRGFTPASAGARSIDGSPARLPSGPAAPLAAHLSPDELRSARMQAIKETIRRNGRGRGSGGRGR